MPSSADQSAGFVPSEPAPAEYFNWLANTTDQWLRYLDEQGNSTVLASSLDFSTRLLGGGTWSLAGTTLAWSAPFSIAIPSANDGDNTVAAGSLALPAGSLAYVTANMPFSTSATVTSGSAQLTSVLYGDQAVVGQLVAGAGIPANTTVKTISADGQTITLSAAATGSYTGATITFRSSGVLSPQVAVSSAFVPGPNTVMFARGQDGSVVVGVGSGQMLLRQGEAKLLLGHGYTSSGKLTAGAALTALAAVYISPGAVDGGRTAGAVYPADVSVASNVIRAQVAGFAAASAAAGADVEVVMAGRLAGFGNLSPGAAYYMGNGSITAGRSGLRGTWLTPVGQALSTNVLLVACGPTQMVGADATLGAVNATSVVNAAGFKAPLPMGTFYHTQTATNTAYATFATVVDNQTNAVSRAILRQPMSHSGSIVGITAYSSGAAGGKATIQPFVNDQPLLDANGVGIFTPQFSVASGGKGSFTFARGAVPFSAADVLTAKITFDTAGNQVLQVFFTIELTAA